MRDPNKGTLSSEPITPLLSNSVPTSLLPKGAAVLCFVPHPFPFMYIQEEHILPSYIQLDIQLVDTVTDTPVSMASEHFPCTYVTVPAGHTTTLTTTVCHSHSPDNSCSGNFSHWTVHY